MLTMSAAFPGATTLRLPTWIGNKGTTKRMTMLGISSSLSTCAKEWATSAIGKDTEACKAFWIP